MAMIPVIDGDNFMNPSALDELHENNATMPNVSKVIYNVGKKAYPKRDPETGKLLKDTDGKPVYDDPVDILATTVCFIDNTKVTVINSQHDDVVFEDHVLSDGSTVKVASKESKERGLIYAIVKRLISKPDADGKMKDSGLGRILNELVDTAFDSTIADAEAKIQKNAQKKAYEESQKSKTEKPKRPSFLSTACAMAESQKELAECIKLLREDLAELKTKLT